jgi:hypothetical protein
VLLLALLFELGDLALHLPQALGHRAESHQNPAVAIGSFCFGIAQFSQVLLELCDAAVLQLELLAQADDRGVCRGCARLELGEGAMVGHRNATRAHKPANDSAYEYSYEQSDEQSDDGVHDRSLAPATDTRRRAVQGVALE